MKYRILMFIGGMLFSVYGYGNPKIDNFENLLSLVCSDPNFAATSQLQMEVAKQRMESSQLDTWMPQVSVGIDVYSANGRPTSFFAIGRDNILDPGEPNINKQGEAWLGKVNLDWSLYSSGQWVGEDGIAQSTVAAEYQVAKAKSNNSHREAIQMVSQYYFNALMYNAQIDMITPLVEKRKAQLDDIQTKVSAGVDTAVTFLTANAAYLSLKEQLKQALRQRKINVGYLQLITNTQLEMNDDEKGSSVAELASISDQDVAVGDVDNLIMTHPDVIILAAKLALEKQKLDLYYGKMKPNLNLYVKLRTADDFADANRQNYGEIGLAFEYPIGEIVRNNNETKALRKSITAIEVELAYLRKMKMLLASNIGGDFNSAKSSVALAVVQLDRRQQIVDSDVQLVNSGLMALDDLLKSEDDKIAAEINLLSAYKQAWTEYMDAAVFNDSACMINL